MAESRSWRPRVVGHIKTRPLPELPAAFSAPDYGRVLGVDNPFPVGHDLHAEWERRRLAAASAAAQLSADLQAEYRRRVRAEPKRGWAAARDFVLDWSSGLFDIRATAVLLPGRPPKAYAERLTADATAILSYVEETEIGMLLRDELGPMLTGLLRERHAHWMAEAYAADAGHLASNTAVTEAAATVPRLTTTTASAGPLVLAAWADIQIRYVSDHALQFVVNGVRQQVQNYTELGFDDKRRDTPNGAWKTLLEIGGATGLLKVDRSPLGYPKQQKRVQEIRKWLRLRFTCAQNPLPLAKNDDYYRPRFKVTRAAAFDDV